MEYLKQIQIAQIGARRHITRRGDVYVEQTWRAKVSSVDPELLSNIAEKCCLSNILIELDGIEAKPRFVQQLAIERMGPVYDRIFHWLIRT